MELYGNNACLLLRILCLSTFFLINSLCKVMNEHMQNMELCKDVLYGLVNKTYWTLRFQVMNG